jgi:hypothetical protein
MLSKTRPASRAEATPATRGLRRRGIRGARGPMDSAADSAEYFGPILRAADFMPKA